MSSSGKFIVVVWARSNWHTLFRYWTDLHRDADVKDDVKMACCAYVWICHTILTIFVFDFNTSQEHFVLCLWQAYAVSIRVFTFSSIDSGFFADVRQ